MVTDPGDTTVIEADAAERRREHWQRITNVDEKAGDTALTDAQLTEFGVPTNNSTDWLNTLQTIGQHGGWMFAKIVSWMHARPEIGETAGQEQYLLNKYFGPAAKGEENVEEPSQDEVAHEASADANLGDDAPLEAGETTELTETDAGTAYISAADGLDEVRLEEEEAVEPPQQDDGAEEIDKQAAFSAAAGIIAPEERIPPPAIDYGPR